eukprot:15352107-Ditylum_brightwellii.AAC.1
MSFVFKKEILGHVLGPAKGKGNEMAHLTKVKSSKFFDSLIERRWGTSINPLPETTPNDQDTYDEYKDDDEIASSLPEVEETVDAIGTLIDQQQAYNRIINAEVQLHCQDHLTTGNIKMRVIRPDYRTSGLYHDNPKLNPTVYEVEFPDREVKEYAAN